MRDAGAILRRRLSAFERNTLTAAASEPDSDDGWERVRKRLGLNTVSAARDTVARTQEKARRVVAAELGGNGGVPDVRRRPGQLREELLTGLLDGPLTTAALRRRVDCTPVAAIQNVTALQADGLVHVGEKRHSRDSPLVSLTDAGRAAAPAPEPLSEPEEPQEAETEPPAGRLPDYPAADPEWEPAPAPTPPPEPEPTVPERVVAFLYVLMRDQLPTGAVDALVAQMPRDEVRYSAPELEALARRYAAKLCA